MNTTPAIDAWITEASDRSVLVSFGEVVTEDSHSRVMALFESLLHNPVRGVTNLHPGYNSLLIRFDPLQIRHSDVGRVVRDLLFSTCQTEEREPRTVTIPVCYGGEFGPDLGDVAAGHGLSLKDAVELHASTTYTVYFLGFVPGFAYLGMLPEQLATPRLPTPRKQVPKGSVAIADRQTGVYPASTPGGWRLIGRTPSAMFDVSRPAMSLLLPGDLVRFQPISEAIFHAAVAS